MDPLVRAQAHVAEVRPRLLLPEQDDTRVGEAAKRLVDLGFVLVATPAAPPKHPARSLRQSDAFEALLQPFFARKPGLDPDRAQAYLREPTHRAAACLALGHADLMVSGAKTETATVLRAGLRAVGLHPHAPLICSSFLMRFPGGRDLLFGDCAVHIDPNAEQLTQIGMHLAATAQTLFGEARLAMLSYSTGTSGAGPSVDLVRRAVDALQAKGYIVFGPIQGDAALNPETGARKGMADARPNVLVFPNINAGNIGYKLCQELAGAQAIGPLLHGFARPMADLSRGATVDDIVDVALLTALGSVGI